MYPTVPLAIRTDHRKSFPSRQTIEAYLKLPLKNRWKKNSVAYKGLYCSILKNVMYKNLIPLDYRGMKYAVQPITNNRKNTTNVK